MIEKTVKKRNANMELLRLLSMFMVVMLHAVGKSNLLRDSGSGLGANNIIAWVFEAMSLCAVNVFILISGYFLIDSKFKLGRLVELLAEMIFYSLGAFLVCMLLGVDIHEEINVYFLLHTVLPMHMDLYWFLTAYVFVYIMLPIIQAGVKNIPQKHFRIALNLLLILECGFKSCLPFKLEEDKMGYNLIWFLTVFLIGAYIKMYGLRFLNKPYKGWICYGLQVLLILLETGTIYRVYVKYGHLESLLKVATDYNHLFVILAAVGLFAAFLSAKPMNEKVGRVVCMLSPMALGVYLYHENLSLRYNWQKWLGIYESLDRPTPQFVGRLLLAVVIIFVCGLAIDFVRIQIFKLFKMIFGKIFVKNET